MNAVVLGDLNFEVRSSDRRRTFGITIERDGRLVLTAPTSADPAQIERFACAKRQWVYEKLAARETVSPPLPTRRYVSGEGQPYLGRMYRLLLVRSQDVPLKLEAGRFKMRREDSIEAHALMRGWYIAHARPWLDDRIARYAGRIGVRPAGLTVQDLGYRWGSCGKSGRLYFHWRTILLPPRIVEYIVAHELVHLREPHHTPEFWRALERTMPDYRLRQQWLAEHGGMVGGV